MSEPLLLYDGACGLCAASVQFILRHERRHTLRFAALQSEAGIRIRARYPELANVDSMVWVEGESGRERVAVRSAAVMLAARYLGGPWSMVAAGRVLPARLRDAIYDVIARHRHTFFGGPEHCYLPPPEMMSRFLS